MGGARMMLDFLERLLHPGNVACLAAIFIVIGLEVDDAMLRQIFDILAGIIALVGFFIRPRSPAPD